MMNSEANFVLFVCSILKQKASIGERQENSNKFVYYSELGQIGLLVIQIEYELDDLLKERLLEFLTDPIGKNVNPPALLAE